MLESLFYKVASLQACNSLKKRLLHRCFLVKFLKFLRTPILKKDYRKIAPGKFLHNRFPPRLRSGLGLGSGVIFRGAIFQGTIFLVPSRTSVNDCLCVLIASSYIDFYNSLKYTFFIFTNNFFFITQLKQ